MNLVAIDHATEFVLDGTHGSPVRKEAGIPVLSAQNVKGGLLDYKTDRYTSTAEYEDFKRRLPIERGDVLLTIVGTIGRSAVIDMTPPLVFQRSVAVLRPRPDRLCSRFLYHFTQSRDFQTQLSRASNQSSQAGVYLGKLKKLQIPLPPLPEQQRIAAILDKADALRAKRRAALKKLDELTQSIFLDMFGDPIENPRAWPLKSLGELGAVDRGVSKHRPRNAPELLGGPYPFVQTGNVANCDGYVRVYSATYSETGLRQSKLWPAGTLCITIAANIAKTGILTFDACFPDSVVGFTVDEPATVEYVRVWLSFLQQTLEKRAPESAQKNINLEILRTLDVPVPDIRFQREFAKRVAAVENSKDKCRRAIACGEALFTSLQHRAFRGEL